MALPTDQQSTQVGTYEKILTIANRIMNGGEITKKEAIELIHTSDDDTMILLAMAEQRMAAILHKYPHRSGKPLWCKALQNKALNFSTSAS